MVEVMAEAALFDHLLEIAVGGGKDAQVNRCRLCATDTGDALVCATTSPVAPHERISLTFRAINSARAVVFLVTGAGKAARVAEVHAQLASGEPVLPAARVRPAEGRLIWMLDAAAAVNLEESR